jgi:RNA polymerase sigma-70 factor, ECF subfamily
LLSIAEQESTPISTRGFRRITDGTGACAAYVIDAAEIDDDRAVRLADSRQEYLAQLFGRIGAQAARDRQNYDAIGDLTPDIEVPLQLHTNVCLAARPAPDPIWRDVPRYRLDSRLSTNFSSRRVYFMQDPDDSVLVARTLAGETDAFAALVARYERVLFRVAVRMLGDRADAADAAQAAFIKAYERLTSFDRNFRFFSWIYRILLNECLNAKRSRRSHEEVTADLVASESPLEALEIAERQRQVQQALLALPGDYRKVVVLRHYAELSYEDIAATLGIPEKTVKSRLYTARQRLSELLVDGDDSNHGRKT